MENLNNIHHEENRNISSKENLQTDSRKNLLKDKAGNSNTPVSRSKSLTVFILVAFTAGIVGGAGTSALVIRYFLPAAPSVQISKNTGAPENSIKNAGIVKAQTYVEESKTINAIKKISPAVVSIVATKDLKTYYRRPYSLYDLNEFNFFDDIPDFRLRDFPDGKVESEIQRQKIGGGSGFIMTAEGLILTNRHVVQQQGVDYTAVLKDGAEYDVEVISRDTLNDLAVLQLVKKGEIPRKKEERTKIENLPVVEFGDSSALEVGQNVVAIGYALGEYENTVTSGIISAKGRNIEASDNSGANAETLSGLLQTDAAINPGNSGGPLVNLAGQVVGVNVAIDRTGASIGFAIPINDVKSVIESIKKHGRIVRPRLGVSIRHLSPETAKMIEEQYRIKSDYGAMIIGDEENGKEEFAVIPNSPAAKAGLRFKDVILSVNGQDVNINNLLPALIGKHQPGDEVVLKILRDGKTFELKIKLEEIRDEA